MKTLANWFFTLVLITVASVSNAAVILQYHHISDSTPRSTSLSEEEFRSHMAWLQRNQFTVIALPQLIERIKEGSLSPQQRLAIISFDDTGETVCSTAAPLLLKRKWPFTIFVNTEAMQGSRQCSWQQLNDLLPSGLLTLGNHSHSHAHMTKRLSGEKDVQWRARITKEISQAADLIKQHTGEKTTLFAYPYGEYNSDIQAISTALGYSSVGQQSGAIGNNSDLSALPRFPLSGLYSNIDTIAPKLLSLPFPLQRATLHFEDSKMSKTGATTNPAPQLELTLSEVLPDAIRCFLGSGEHLTTQSNSAVIKVQTTAALPPGRHRYNCTARSSQPGRFYWYSQQWLQP